MIGAFIMKELIVFWFPNTCWLWRHLRDIHKGSDWGLAHRVDISGPLDLEMSLGGKDIDGEKDGGRIVDVQAVRNRFGSWLVSNHEKLFDVGKLVQRVRV